VKKHQNYFPTIIPRPFFPSCLRASVPPCLLYAFVPSCLLLASCAGPPEPVPYARVYPTDLARGQTLDIQVIKHDTSLEFTNTTARAFGPSTLWLNSYYCQPVEGIAVGQTIRMPLSGFRNEHSESFRGGGFFAADEPERLVLAELETPGPDGAPMLLGLIVVGTR
jgi:hypothetical protein